MHRSLITFCTCALEIAFAYVRFCLPPLPLPLLSSGPVVAMVWEGKNAVVTGRKMLGATNPADSAPGTIRGDFAIETGNFIFR